jgi:hypothetical protein
MPAAGRYGFTRNSCSLPLAERTAGAPVLWDAMPAIAIWVFLFGTAMSVARRRVHILVQREAQRHVAITST